MKALMALIGFVAAMTQVCCDSAKVQPESQLVTKILTDKSSYKLGEAVTMSLNLTNSTDKDMVMRFNTGQHYDFWAVKDGKEVWRWARGKAFTQALNSMTLKPGETKTFSVKWDQKTDNGEQIAPGSYTLFGQLTTARPRPQPVSVQISIGTSKAAVEGTTIRAILQNTDSAVGRTVSISGNYLGWRPDPNAPACKEGPPVMRSDWAISDGTGCIYVTGKSALNPTSDYGKSIILIGVVRKTDKGQPYIEAQTVKLKD